MIVAALYPDVYYGHPPSLAPPEQEHAIILALGQSEGRSSVIVAEQKRHEQAIANLTRLCADGYDAACFDKTYESTLSTDALDQEAQHLTDTAAYESLSNQ